jgi:capsular polysaccharide biosynthesis protein
MTKNKSLSLNSKIVANTFAEKVKEQFVEKYARDMVRILEDQAKLERALTKINKTIELVHNGDYSAIEKYKKARQVLEVEEDVEL